jgi:transposase-like protein
MTSQPSPDLDLVTRAIRKFGSAAALARKMGVAPNTPNEWLRRLRRGGTLSRDKRRLLSSTAGQMGEESRPERTPDQEPAQNRRASPLDSETWERELSGLPPKYRGRFAERLKGERERMLGEVEHRLREFIQLLRAEWRAGRRQRRD